MSSEIGSLHISGEPESQKQPRRAKNPNQHTQTLATIAEEGSEGAQGVGAMVTIGPDGILKPVFSSEKFKTPSDLFKNAYGKLEEGFQMVAEGLKTRLQKGEFPPSDFKRHFLDAIEDRFGTELQGGIIHTAQLWLQKQVFERKDKRRRKKRKQKRRWAVSSLEQVRYITSDANIDPQLLGDTTNMQANEPEEEHYSVLPDDVVSTFSDELSETRGSVFSDRYVAELEKSIANHGQPESDRVACSNAFRSATQKKGFSNAALLKFPRAACSK